VAGPTLASKGAVAGAFEHPRSLRVNHFGLCEGCWQTARCIGNPAPSPYPCCADQARGIWPASPDAPLSPVWPRGARLSGPARASPRTWLAALSRVVIRELFRARVGGHPGVGV